MNPVTLGLNKWRLILILLVSIFFLFNGLTMFFVDKTETVQTNPVLVKTIGLLSLGLFGTILYIASKQLFDNSLGVYLDASGISDYSNAMGVGQVEWEDIERIEIQKFLWMKSLAIHTSNPGKYLRDAKGIKLRILAGNLSRAKTPVVISSRNLKIRFSTFEAMVREYWEKSKESSL
ncbi:MAG: STM3941 family protein [Crocinitomicaceae bacterium]